jgi:hypothetical protein
MLVDTIKQTDSLRVGGEKCKISANSFKANHANSEPLHFSTQKLEISLTYSVELTSGESKFK